MLRFMTLNKQLFFFSANFMEEILDLTEYFLYVCYTIVKPPTDATISMILFLFQRSEMFLYYLLHSVLHYLPPNCNGES